MQNFNYHSHTWRCIHSDADYLDEQYVISSFLEKEEITEKIIEYNGDIKKLSEFVEAQI